MKNNELITYIYDKLESEKTQLLYDLYDFKLKEGELTSEQEDEYYGKPTKFVRDYIESLLDYIDFDSENRCFDKYSDKASEWSNNQVEIRYYYIYKACYIFSDYADEVANDGTYDFLSFTLSEFLQKAECRFYEDFSDEILHILESDFL